MNHRNTAVSRVLRLVPLAAFIAAGGCFATRNDVRVVQSDLANVRTEMLKGAAEQREALAQALRVLQVASDSVKIMSNRLTSVQGDVRGGLRAIDEQLIQVQVLLRQSQDVITRLRQEQQERLSLPTIVPPPTASGVPITAADSQAAAAAASQPQTPEITLYQKGRQNLMRGSYSTARQTFQELLDKSPNGEWAPAAQAGIGQTYEGEKNIPAAIAAYGAVIQKFPDAPASSLARFKLAKIYIAQNKPTEARPLLQTIVDRFKTGDEYDLAVIELDKLRKPPA